MVQPQGYYPEAGQATEYAYNEPYGAPAADGGYPATGAVVGWWSKILVTFPQIPYIGERAFFCVVIVCVLI